MLVRSSLLGIAAIVLAVAPAGAFDPRSETAHYEIEYRAVLGPLAAGAECSVRVWFPMPSQNAYQTVVSTQVQAPWPHRETQDSCGNRFIYLEGRKPLSTGAAVVLRFVVERKPARGISQVEVRRGTPLDPSRHVGAHRRVPIGGAIRRIAEQETQGLATDREKIHALYNYVYRTMRYSKEGQGWGRGDAVWALTSKYGNCSDFHSLFIGMARSLGIPARFVMGFRLPPDKDDTSVPGYHCWAEAYESERGWIPLDASEAWMAKRNEEFFGFLPSDRVEFSEGRDITLEPAQDGEPLNYFIYPYAEVNRAPISSIPWTLHFRRIEPTVVR